MLIHLAPTVDLSWLLAEDPGSDGYGYGYGIGIGDGYGYGYGSSGDGHGYGEGKGVDSPPPVLSEVDVLAALWLLTYG